MSAEDDWNFLHEELLPALVVGGVLLVLFPDPVTTTVGLAFVAVAVVLWARDLLQ